MKANIRRKAREKYIVTLSQEERDDLLSIVSKGKSSAKKITHARILLQSDESEGGKNCSDIEIAEALDIAKKTVWRVRKLFVEAGMEAALTRKIHSQTKPKRFGGEEEANLIALACSRAPEGRSRWTLKLLADKIVELQIIDKVSPATVGRTLKKTNLSLG